MIEQTIGRPIEFAVVVEDDNGRYFKVVVVAVDWKDAIERVAYIIDGGTARIIPPGGERANQR